LAFVSVLAVVGVVGFAGAFATALCGEAAFGLVGVALWACLTTTDR
jgi:hypothetical protein